MSLTALLLSVQPADFYEARPENLRITVQIKMKILKLDKTNIIYLSCEILVATVAILGNALVAVTFLRDRRMRTPTNLYIFSLGAVNLLTSVVAIPAYLHSMMTQRPRDFTACLYVNTMLMTFCTISIFHLVAVTFDRYIAVVWGHSPVSHRRGMRHAIISVVIAWVLGSLVGVLPLMGWNGGKPNQYEVSKCEFMRVMDMTYLMFVFYATVVTPSVLLIFFYISMYCTMHRHKERLASVSFALDSRMSIKQKKRRVPSEHGDEHEEEHANLEENVEQEATEREIAKMKRVTNSLFLVIVLFHICWYPLHIMNVISYYKAEDFFEKWHFYAPIVLSHAANAINPFIYGLTMPGYKDAFVEALACKTVDEHSSAKRFRRKYQLTERY